LEGILKYELGFY